LSYFNFGNIYTVQHQRSKMNILFKIGSGTLVGAILLRIFIGYVTRPDADGRIPSADEVAGHIPISDGMQNFLEHLGVSEELIEVSEVVHPVIL